MKTISLLTLWTDKKFRLLTLGILLVAVFEVLSLSGYQLPNGIGIPLFSIVIVIIGRETLLSGLKALLRFDFKSISLLVVIAVIGAFYIGEYVEAAIVIVLFTLGEYLEDFGIQASRSSLRALVERAPKTAKIKGRDEEVVLENLMVGDTVLVQPGDFIPVDGTISLGQSSIDESTITGEPIPKDKHIGEIVYAGTLNINGYLEIIISKLAKDSTLSKIIELTFNAGKAKAESQKFIERFSRFYTPSIIALTILIVIIPTVFFGKPFELWFTEGLTLLVIACPCALVISTPVAVYSAIGNASSKGVIIKGGKFVEGIGRIRAIALDKTRTITEGKPVVTDIIPFGSTSREHLLACAAGIEQYSEHPLARSIVEAAKAEKIEPHPVEHFQSVFGKGATAQCLVCYDKDHAIGKLEFIKERTTVEKNVIDSVDRLYNEGKTAIIISAGITVEGIIAVADTIKPESVHAIEALSALAIEPVMLTGDNRIPAALVAERVGIKTVKSELLPEGKVEEIKKLLSEYGNIAMVGDGVNDAPALAMSTVGIAMAASGSDTAIESADIAILNDNLLLLPFLVSLGRQARKTITLNVSLAITVKIVFILLAIFGISNLALAIFADVGMTLIVILLSLRLMRFDGIERNIKYSNSI
ncbi:MAG TPA: cation-translocating P-type ATPase [Candidatus Kapabacteria bacterium]|nr:cation-translocating P-type ATPase [Candidatus Kapabacteria bacterium]